MSWSSPSDFKSQVQKWWDRGDLLASAFDSGIKFPRRLQLKGPTSVEMSDLFEDVRNWIAILCKTRYCRIEMREVNHRQLGKNLIPAEAWIDTLEDAVAFINKTEDLNCFRALVKLTSLREPDLLDWTEKNALRVLKLRKEWERLLAIVTWMKNNPRPAIYLRQVDIEGIDSKFMESHRGVLSELLDAALPPDRIARLEIGVNRFAERYGFKNKPLRIRFRILDNKHALLPMNTEQDMALDAVSFAGLETSVSKVLITENEINYLSIPALPDTMVIFGAGYGFEMLAPASWLGGRKLYYWGDIDTHGLAILNSARTYVPHLQSMLMDEETLLRHRSLWGCESKQHSAEKLPNLDAAEANLYMDLREQKWAPNVRLEQERVGWNYAWKVLSDELY